MLKEDRLSKSLAEEVGGHGSTMNGHGDVDGHESFKSRGFTSYISMRTLAVTGVIIAVILILEGTSGGRLLQGVNIGGVLDASSEIGFIAIGVTILMIGGEFDLSVGQSFVAAGMTFATIYSSIGVFPAILVGLAIGAAIGFVNGTITLAFGIPSFITTLGTSYVVAGMILLVTGAAPISAISLPSSFKIFGGYVFGLPVRWEVVWWIGLVIIMALVLHKTAFGNHIFAAGGKAEVARNVGVRIVRTKMALFILCGMFAAFSGIVLFAHLGDIEASAGSGLQLEAIAAAVIGGTALFGGVGTVYGGAVGSLFLGVLTVGLVLSGASTRYYELFVGIVLIGAVALQAKVEGISTFTKRLLGSAKFGRSTNSTLEQEAVTQDKQ